MEESTSTSTSTSQRPRPATKYRLSVGSNSGSRRSSLGLTDNVNTYNANQNVFKEVLLPRIGELTEAIMTLENNLSRLNEIHNNLVDFNESFGSFIYGLLCTTTCSHFSGVPSNLEGELRRLKRLQDLKTERDRLRVELKQLKVRNGSSQGDLKGLNSSDRGIPKNTQFAEPLFRASQVARNTRGSGNVRSDTGIGESFGDRHDMDNEDNSSEASFVMNPVQDRESDQLKNRKIKDRAQPPGIVRRVTGDNKRRKSILDTIRSGRRSYGSASDGPTVGQSLAPPRRNAAHTIASASRSTTRATATRGAIRSTSLPGRDGARVTKPTPGVTRRRTLENRPPFR